MGRVPKDCPFPECTAKNLVRLALHLSKVHKVKGEERKSWLIKAKEQSHGVLKTPDRLTNLATSRGKPTESSGEWWKEQSLLPFQPCSSICITGATGSGKTRFVYRLLTHAKGMYADEAPAHVMYCYGVHQSLYETMEKTLPNLTLHEGLPSTEELDEYTRDGRHKLIVLDDLMHAVIRNTEMELLFTQGCHHRKISIIFITQNLFAQGKSARTIHLNTWYLVLFKNVRDVSQIARLGRQLFPKRSHVLIDAYQDCMKEPYGYILMDMSPQVEDKYRLRTRVFPGEDPIIYIPKNQ